MFKITIKSLLGHKVRVVITALAVVVGVSFMAGTFVLTDTITSNFNSLFSSVNKGVDAVVRKPEAFSVSAQEGPGSGTVDERGEVPLSLVDQVAKVPGVAAAEANVFGRAFPIGSEGKTINPTSGAPQFGGNWIVDQTLTPYTLRAGRPPQGPGEVVIDRGTAKRADVKVGNRLRVQALGPAFTARVVGIASFGKSDNFAGASFVLMDTVDASRAFGTAGKATNVMVHGDAGLSQQQLVARLRTAFPRLEAITGAKYIKEQQDSVQKGFSAFSTILSGFAVVSLIAGAFLIYNIFGIIVAQRTRELALLRALGASRKQVTRSVLLEALATGLIASFVGLLAGIGLAQLLTIVLAAVGLDLPSKVVDVAPRTIIVSVLAGTVVTTLSALIPARRASRVPPIAAIRDVAIESAGTSKVRLGIGSALAVLGALSLVSGANSQKFQPVLTGVVLLFAGVVVLGPRLAPILTRGLGAWLPSVKGLTGRLARENAMRSPKRTASTATSLILAITLVGTLTIFLTSFTATINAAVTKGFKGDFQISAGGFTGLSPTLASTVRDLPQVDAVAGLSAGTAALDGDGINVWGTDGPDLAKLLDIKVDKGSLDQLTGADTMALDSDTAAKKRLPVGSSVLLSFADGQRQRFKVVATYAQGGQIGQGASSNYLLPRAAFTKFEPAASQSDLRVLVKGKGGVSDGELRAVLDKVSDDYPTAKVQSLAEIKETQTSQIRAGLAFFLVLMAFSVIVGFFGIAVTLALAVIERTRELGLLRAVGMDRRRMRSMVRWEAVLIALLGTFIGLVLGVAGGAALAATLGREIDTARVSVPVGLLVVFALFAALFGIVAAIYPAYRASKLDVLRAITVE